MRQASGALWAAIVVVALSETGGAQAERSAVRCQTPHFCILGWYDVQVSSRVNVTGPNWTEQFSFSGTFKRLRVDGEFTPATKRGAGVRPRPPQIRFSSEIGGAGTTVATVALHGRYGCTLARTYRHRGNATLEGGVLLGVQPTRKQLLLNADVPAGLDVEGSAGDDNYNPQVDDVCPDAPESGIRDLVDSFGVGKCVDPPGADLTYDRNCLRAEVFSVFYTSQVVKRQTLTRMAFPFGRLWAKKSFVVSGHEKQKLGDHVADVQVRLAMTRRR